MTKKELSAELKRLELEVPEKATRDELAALVASAHGDPTGTPHILTQEDFDNNQGGFADCKVGDVVVIPAVNMSNEEGMAAQATDEAEKGIPAQPESSTPVLGGTDGDGLVEVKVRSNLLRNGEHYVPGTTIVLSSVEAEAMRADGTVE